MPFKKWEERNVGLSISIPIKKVKKEEIKINNENKFFILLDNIKYTIKKLKRLDFMLIFTSLALLSIGIAAVYSATHTRTSSFYQNRFYGIYWE